MVRSVCGCEKYWNLYQLAEKLIDIEDWLQQWRFRHMKTVERIIGHKMVQVDPPVFLI